MAATRRDVLSLSLLATLGPLAGSWPAPAAAEARPRPRRWGVNPTWPRRWLGQWLLGDLATLAYDTNLRSFDDAELAALAAGAELTLSTGEQLYAIADNGGLTPGGAWTVEWSGTGRCSLAVLGASATPAGRGPPPPPSGSARGRRTSSSSRTRATRRTPCVG